jgi:acetolactate synthase-1/2/3 large subunit
MNGAESLINALADAGVDVCFANPGTSEMQLVAAIDQQPKIRGILCLFEGVVTGAADGYGRMADKPALTLLHLGPGLGNGTANLHNAKRAFSPVLNMVGDHATYHLQYDAPLTADIEGFAEPVSGWIGVSQSPDDLASTGMAALSESMRYPGQIATFIAPADHAWEPASPCTTGLTVPDVPTVSDEQLARAVAALQGDGERVLFLGGRALREDALWQAGRIAAATGARLVTETFCARHQRGAGRVPVERLPYFGEQAAEALQNATQMVVVGSKPPVSFFAYPGKPSWLTPEGANLVALADPTIDALDTLTRLADALDAPAEPAQLQPRAQHSLETGPINQIELGKIIANRLPAHAIVSDEGATNSLGAFMMTGCAEPHDWMMLTGGAIGQGLPVAIGAAVACPDRKVLALQADGSAMYTVQSLWTMARENLDITVLLLNNNSYAILNIELQRVGVENPGPTALSLLDLSNPEIQWCDIARGMGVAAERVTTVEDLDAAFARAMKIRGPHLIEVMV